MELRKIDKEKMGYIYKRYMKRTFPRGELKPLTSMRKRLVKGTYEPFGFYDGEELVGYAFFWIRPEVNVAMLDYMAVLTERRGKGVGSAMLRAARAHYPAETTIVTEVEALERHHPDYELRKRRLEFYNRNGFSAAGFETWLFGVTYQVMVQGQMRGAELLKAYENFYREELSERQFRRMTRIPLQNALNHS